MRVIQGFNFYTIKETIQNNVNEKTLYRVHQGKTSQFHSFYESILYSRGFR